MLSGPPGKAGRADPQGFSAERVAQAYAHRPAPARQTQELTESLIAERADGGELELFVRADDC